MHITIKIHTPDKVPNATTKDEIKRRVEEALTPHFPLIETITVTTIPRGVQLRLDAILNAALAE